MNGNFLLSGLETFFLVIERGSKNPGTSFRRLVRLNGLSWIFTDLSNGFARRLDIILNLHNSSFQQRHGSEYCTQLTVNPFPILPCPPPFNPSTPTIGTVGAENSLASPSCCRIGTMKLKKMPFSIGNSFLTCSWWQLLRL